MKRILLLILGLISLGIGIAGIFLPVVPTTGPLLVAAWAFAQSSQRLHRWLANHKLFGPLIAAYREKKGLTLGYKAYTLIVLWAGLGLSAWLVETLWVRLLLAAVGLGVTLHILTLKTRRAEDLSRCPVAGPVAEAARALSESGTGQDPTATR